ncbi:MAG: hypothetical protein EA350_04465 [Gemmatimonadales bacterium]|nr:MAG: hypothetical protein EA350_04465 [Gemmatimonadales bacterium]
MSHLRRPLFFGPDDTALFGFYDAPSEHRLRDAVVVLCPPMGDEYIRSHRAFVQLARQLCGAGFPVLRFDFSGCGDSWGEAADAGLSRWVEDARLAIEEARTLSGRSRVRLVGLRLGATVAAMAARERGVVDGVALWAPVADGRRHVLELERRQSEFLRFAYVTAERTGRSPGARDTEILGFPFPDRLRAELLDLSLLSPADPGSSRFLLLDAEGGCGAEELAARLRVHGATVTEDPHPGGRPWNASRNQALVPVEAIARIVKWVSTGPF